MDRGDRLLKIAQLKGSEAWRSVVEELEYQEKVAFESLLSGSTKEEVVATVVILRKMKALPEMAVNVLSKTAQE